MNLISFIKTISLYGWDTIIVWMIAILLFIYIMVQIITRAVLSSFYREKRRITRKAIKDLKIRLKNRNEKRFIGRNKTQL
jgi:uncharacterized membrane protein